MKPTHWFSLWALYVQAIFSHGQEFSGIGSSGSALKRTHTVLSLTTPTYKFQVSASSSSTAPHATTVASLKRGTRRQPEYMEVMSKKKDFKRTAGQMMTELARSEISEDQRMRRIMALDLKSRQLDTLEQMLNTSLVAMRQLLSQNVVEQTANTLSDEEIPIESLLQEIQQQNLNIMSDMQSASFQAQQEYRDSVKKIEEAVRDDKAVADTSNGIADNIVEGVLGSLEGSVSQLEESIHRENDFRQQSQVGKLETVVKVVDNTDYLGNTTSNNQLAPSSDRSYSVDITKVAPASTLIDTENNRYVLSRSNDPTEFIEDVKLFQDMIDIVLLSFISCVILEKFRLPSLFGYIFTGILLGPACLNHLRALIQIETIAQFGVLFILYVLGLEFSLEKLRKHWRISVFGGGSMIALAILVTMTLSLFTSLQPSTSLFLGSTISLSSTTVVLKCLNPADMDTKSGREILGILVFQDVFLGIFLVLMPVLGSTGAAIAWRITTIAGKTLFLIVISSILSRTAVQVFVRWSKGANCSSELLVVGSVAACFSFIKMAEYFGLSIELGCFIAGVTMNSSSIPLDRKFHEKIEAIRDFFSCIFFVSIGIHIYPSFLMKQALLLCTVTAFIMGLKLMIAIAVLSFGFRLNFNNVMAIGVGLSQISEFAFVLASRGKSMKILNKEAYYLLLGATSISLIITPLLWSLVKQSIHTKHISL